jgi:hypothetical protein
MLSVAIDFDQQCRNNFLIAISNKYLLLEHAVAILQIELRCGGWRAAATASA